MIEQKHSTRCNKCKTAIYSLLQNIFGTIEWKFKAENVSVHLEAYENSAIYKDLERIYFELGRFRGNKEFVRSKNLQRCDLYVPSKKLIVETDEYQHFTAARIISLKKYPKYFPFGFDSTQYIERCKNINSNDSDPEDRDEQRAWYDTIRDFLPLIIPTEVKKTIRIPLGFHCWCSLDVNNSVDIKTFKSLALKGMK